MPHPIRRPIPWLLLAGLTTPVSGLAAPRSFANPTFSPAIQGRINCTDGNGGTTPNCPVVTL